MGNVVVTSGKKVKIVMTDSAPVMVDTGLWPTIATVRDTSYRGRGKDPNPDQHDDYLVKVRQRADGRTLVYATLRSAMQRDGDEDVAAGVHVPAGQSIPDAIRAVVAMARLPHSMAARCIANLPPVELV